MFIPQSTTLLIFLLCRASVKRIKRYTALLFLLFLFCSKVCIEVKLFLHTNEIIKELENKGAVSRLILFVPHRLNEK
jgi:hypothetical protein